MKQSDIYNEGWGKYKEIDSEAGGKGINCLKDISADIRISSVEFAFGDIYTKNGLDLKSKEIAVVAALTAMGTAKPHLKIHINGALNTGSSINELKEVILQMSVYSGFPSSIYGMNALKEVLNERHELGIKDLVGNTAKTDSALSDRIKAGERELSQLYSLQVDRLSGTYTVFSPELVKFTFEHGYSNIFSRDNLDKKYRKIATISALTAMGNAQPQLKFHINLGLNIGLTVESIKEIMLLISVYADFPSAINGIIIVKEVIKEREKN